MPEVSIASPASNGTVAAGGFTVTGTITGLVGQVPNPVPITARIRINNQTINATTVTLDGTGGFVATFPAVAAGTGGVIDIKWDPTGDVAAVDNITVSSGGGGGGDPGSGTGGNG